MSGAMADLDLTESESTPDRPKPDEPGEPRGENAATYRATADPAEVLDPASQGPDLVQSNDPY
jgi:hypothetical protein